MHVLQARPGNTKLWDILQTRQGTLLLQLLQEVQISTFEDTETTQDDGKTETDVTGTEGC